MKTKLISTSSGISLYELCGEKLRVQISSYGARIFKILVKDKNGQEIDVVAGFETPEDFLKDDHYFNGVVGRVANRIGEARFTLNGKEYHLTPNDNGHSLHGGKEGFDHKYWTSSIEQDESVLLTYLSADGEEGYPGNLKVTVRYSITNEDTLRIEYGATSDKDTLCSLTNHANFNLDGDFKTILDHIVFINSDKLTAIDGEFIARGEIFSTKGTVYDFSTPKKIGKDINTDDFMMNVARGYDFNYILNNDGIHPVAYAYSENSGVKMEVFTDRDCMQFYTGNFLNGIKGRKTYEFQSAFCMEAQGYPNACNIPSFPSVVLKKGETYSAFTAYRFSTVK